MAQRVPAPELTSESDELRMSIWDHLNELRQRVFKALIAIVLGTVVGLFLAEPVLQILIQPYGRELSALGPTEPVIAFFRVALTIGACLAIPMITYQLMSFITPGLTAKEKRMIFMALPVITLLFVVGVAFAWFILIPPALGVLEGFQPTLFKPEWTADLYLSFITSLVFWMGVAFETPLIFFVISVLGFVTAKTLIQNWRVAVVGASILAAMITPTIDPVNMFLVMGPLMTLYALSILLVMVGSRINVNRVTP